MAQNDFFVSRRGIKISYLRFISDSAVGYIILLLIIFSTKLGSSLPFPGFTWNFLHGINFGKETLIFVLLISFLLASPLGLLINAISWFLLGFIQINFSVALLRIPYPFFGTSKITKCFEEIYRFIAFEETLSAKERYDTLYRLSYLIEELIYVYFNDIYSKYEHAKGVSRFLRSMSLLFLYISLYSLICNVKLAFIYIVCAILFLMLAAYAYTYFRISMLFSAYALCYNINSKSVSEREFIIKLNEAGKSNLNPWAF